MSESYIQSLFAERIGGSQYGKSQAIYKFEKIKRAKRAAMTAHLDGLSASIRDVSGLNPEYFELAPPQLSAAAPKHGRRGR